MLYGLLISLVNLGCGFIFFWRIHLLIMSSKEDYWEWDKKSLTAADYSVELYVEEIYKEYLKENG